MSTLSTPLETPLGGDALGYGHVSLCVQNSKVYKLAKRGGGDALGYGHVSLGVQNSKVYKLAKRGEGMH